MTLEVGDLRVFLTVAREGSFGRAASRMLVSQPSISERVARLEREAGATLFERGPRGVRLTDAGSRLVPYAERTMALLDEAASAVVAADRPLPVRVGVHVTFAHRAVPLVLEALHGSHRSLKVRDAHSDEVIAMLLDGVIDIGFVLPGSRPPALRFIALPPDPVIAVCAPDHALASRRSVALPTLGEHRVALNRWGTGAATVLDQLATAGAPESHWAECSDAITALRLARSHGFVSFVTTTIAVDALDSGDVVRIPLRPALAWNVPLVFAHRRADSDDDVVRAVRDAVKAMPANRGRRVSRAH